MRSAFNKLLFFRIEKPVLLILFICFFYSANSQNDSTYSFLVAGHAYGAHAGTNIGLHPPFLKKLAEKNDSVMAVFLTGDIVNQSTNASWSQVEKELLELGLNSYYVMGNHDNNTLGHSIFKEKHGGDYYYFNYKNDLYIILNSTESDRSISKTQLQFIDDIFSNTDAIWNRAFIFFHEIIWNSNVKYKLVRSNSRSRYSQLVNISNFWNEVYPRLTTQTNNKFYLFAGDVGGNPDAIAASYDCWENVTLLSSGMGEVGDENYLKVTVLPDTVEFELISLNDQVEMKPISWYNIPEKPDSIFGLSTVFPSQSEVNYRIEPIENATSYNWILSDGIVGNSDSSKIHLSFDKNFQSGRILATAINDGFGESEPAELKIVADDNTFIPESGLKSKIEIFQNNKSLIINIKTERPQLAHLNLYDLSGRILLNEELFLNSGLNTKTLDRFIPRSGFVILELLCDNQRITKKMLLY